MATQRDLGLVWAITGSAIDPSPTKYSVGWTVERPAYQSFNYVLQNLSVNLLALAEAGNFNWQVDINYVKGATAVASNGLTYTATLNNLGIDPTTGNASWTLGRAFGKIGAGDSVNSQGFVLYDIYPNSSSTNWNGNDLTILNQNPVIYLQSSGLSDNLLFGNIQGSLAVYNAGSAVFPTGAINSLASANTFKIYHEGFKPTQADVVNTIPANANDGAVYGRFNASWTPVVAKSSNASGAQVDAGTSNILYVTPQALTDSGYSGAKADPTDVDAEVNDSRYITPAALAGSDYIKKSEIIDFVYPIGRVFESTSPTNPAIAYGGVWVSLGEGRVTVGFDQSNSLFNTVKDLGGSSNIPVIGHNHIASSGSISIPIEGTTVNASDFSHNKRDGIAMSSNTNVTLLDTKVISAPAVSVGTASNGTSGTNKNLPPYIVVYRWERTA